MAELKEIQKLTMAIVEAIDESVDSFNGSIPELQRRIYEDILDLIKNLQVKNGKVVNSAKNISTIAQIKKRIEKIVLNSQYKAQVKTFVKAFEDVEKMQVSYFSSFAGRYGSNRTIRLVRDLAIDSTIDALMEAGIEANLSNPIRDILSKNITTGGSYAELTEQLRSFIVGDKNTDGRLLRYSKQITTDAIHQYNANVNQIAASDLGLKWYMYVGSNINTTRPFCRHLTEKLYVHESELPEVVQGNIDGRRVPIYDKTGLPHGMVPGTNAANFKIYRGGYNCGHQLMPVPAEVVPMQLRQKFEKAA